MHVAWWTGKQGEAGVYYARSADGAKTFVAQPIATGERARPAHVQLAVSGQRVYLAWDDGLGAMPRVLLRRSVDGGKRFSPDEVLSEHGVAASFPVLALYGDSVAVAWSQTTAAEHRSQARGDGPHEGSQGGDAAAAGGAVGDSGGPGETWGERTMPQVPFARSG